MSRYPDLFAKRPNREKQAPKMWKAEPRSRLATSLRAYRLVEEWDTSDNYDPYAYWVREETTKRHEAELIGSRYLHNNQHMLLLDLDGKLTVVETSDPGRAVLIAHADMSWRQQKKVLFALAEAGLMDQSALNHALKKREVTAVADGEWYTSHKGSKRYNLLLDLNLPTEVHKSKTPGHHHVIVGANLTWFQYRSVLRALAKAGVIEKKWASAAIDDEQAFLTAKGKI